MSKEFIVDKAPCKCSCGSSPGKISVNDQTFSHANGGKLSATTKTIGVQAIASPFFGTCKASFPSRPCLPNIIQWNKFFTKLKIGADSFPLTDESQGICALGGCVEFINTGQRPILGQGQIDTATVELQGELDPTGEAMALTEHQITALSEISEKKEDIAQEIKIISAQWVNSENKALKSIKYKQSAYIFIKTEGITDRVKIKVVDYIENEKVKEWDKASDDDVTFSINISNNMGTKAFTPTDEWFSKRSLNKEVSFEIYHNGDRKDTPKQSLKIENINYNKDMIVSENGIRFTAQEEALAMICPDSKIRPYKDSKGYWTIGIGEKTGTTANTILASKEVAFARFKNKIKGEFQKYAHHLLHTRGVKRKLEQYQFDAIVDLVYNGWNCSPIIDKIADGEKLTEQTFLDFKGKGLADRRKAQFKLYSNQIGSVKGPAEIYRKDNTNEGYGKIEKMKKIVDENGKNVLDKNGNFIMEKEKDSHGNVIMENGYYILNGKETYAITY